MPAASARTPSALPALSLRDTLRIWGRSFAADGRSTLRQTRRALRSLEARYWNPFVREVQHELHQLRRRAVRLASDPRWKQLEAQAISASQNSWRRLKAAMPQWLAEPLGIRQQELRNPTPSAAKSEANRRRAIMYLRRWLHEPANTQRKRSNTSTRRF
jgi:hypothetical protein